jgi:cytochrome c peroxidase
MALHRIQRTLATLASIVACAISLVSAAPASADCNQPNSSSALNQQLEETLDQHGFTGRIESTLEERLGRSVNKKLARIGQDLFFDTLLGLNDDNSCAGCHSPTAGFADTQSIAVGIDNNGMVGPDRDGPRNQRRTPTIINTAFYPTLMWNSRFLSVSGDPFDNSDGLSFTDPEGLSLSGQPHLLNAQVFIPPTEVVEMAGFNAPATHDGVREAVRARVNNVQNYRKDFGRVYHSVKSGGPISYSMIAAAIAEFEISLTFTDAPIDRFARGKKNAMTNGQKRGALLFFGKAGCVSCHAVSGQSNEMFSDFQEHAIGVPQIFPADTNVTFDGPNANEDFGREQLTGDPADRYKFRTSPLRNVGVQPTFFHNGSYTSLEGAVRHHLDVYAAAAVYHTEALAADLQGSTVEMASVLAAVDPLLQDPIALTEAEIEDLVEFVGDGLLDPRARPEKLVKLIPKKLPSGRDVHEFQD